MIVSLALFILFSSTVGFLFFKEIGVIVGSSIAVIYLSLVYFVIPRIGPSKRLEIIDKLSPEIKEFNPEFYLSKTFYALPPKKIYITQQMLDKLSKPEMESIIMREIIRIKKGEVMKEFFLKAISGPLYLLFLQENQSKIDYETAKQTGDPETLANALEKIFGPSQRVLELRKL